MLEAGRSVGRYRIEAPLGAGGMGAVYRAHDTILRRPVALKVLTTAGEKDPTEARARLLREARAAAALRHPNAVAVFDIGEHEGTPFIAMEVVEGRSLRAALRAATASPREDRLRWLVSIADVLAVAHDAGLIHRDIKPENVMVCVDGSIKVLDFGIAKRADADDGPSPEPDSAEAPPSFRTKEGVVTGTPRYMAPEQRSGGALDGRTDQYAWGIVAFEVVCGAHPHTVDFDGSLRKAEADGVPAIVTETIARALCGRPRDRWPNMHAIVARLAPLSSATRFAARSTSSSVADVAASTEQGVATDRDPTDVHRASTMTTPDAAVPRSVASSRGTKRGLLGVALVLVVAMVAIGLRLRNDGTPTAASARPAAPPVSVGAAPAAKSVDPSTAESAPTITSIASSVPTPPKPARTASLSTRAATPPAFEPAPTHKKACDPPFYFDDAGIKMPKRECLQ